MPEPDNPSISRNSIHTDQSPDFVDNTQRSKIPHHRQIGGSMTSPQVASPGGIVKTESSVAGSAGSSGTMATHPNDAYLPAPYGKACAECVKTKRKCMLPPDSGKCQRCSRLHKACSRPPSTGVRKRATGPRASSRAVLEEKLDNLVNLLQQKSGAVPEATSTSAPDGPPPSETNATTDTSAPSPPGLTAPQTINVALSPGRATLEDLAEASASASCAHHIQSSQRSEHQTGPTSYHRLPVPRNPTPQHQHQQLPPTNGSDAHNMNRSFAPFGTVPPPQAMPTIPMQGYSQPQSSFIAQQPQPPPPPSTASEASTPNRAAMPNIFNPAKEFISTALQENYKAPHVANEVPRWLPTHFTPQQEEMMLTSFRTEKSTYFPFIYIPPNVSASRVRSERPFLWLTILIVGCKTASQHLELGGIFREVVGQRILQDQESSLDMLQGLLVYLAWSNYQIHKNVKQFMCLYSHMAMGMLFVLTMNRPQFDGSSPLAPTPIGDNQASARSFSDRDMDEKRATLGLYYLTCTQTSFLHVGSMQGMKWTPAMESMLDELWQKRQAPNDVVLAIMVKSQLIAKDAIKVTRDVSEYGGGELTTMMRTMQYRMLNGRLTEIKNMISQHDFDHYAIRSAISMAEMTVNEIGCWDSALGDSWINSERIQALTRCFNAVRNWFDLFFQLPLEVYTSLPFTLWCQMFRNCCILCKLSTVDDRGWDRNYVRQTLDVLSVISRIEQNLLAVPTAVGFVVDTPGFDIFSRSCRPLKVMRKAWEGHLSTQTNSGAGVMTPADSAFEANQAVQHAGQQAQVGLAGQTPMQTQAPAMVTTQQLPNEALAIDFTSDFDWFADMYYVSEKF